MRAVQYKAGGERRARFVHSMVDLDSSKSFSDKFTKREQERAAPAAFGSVGMCGIAGMVDWRAATSADALRSISEAMIETVRHRGPDAGEVWVEAEDGVALGQRRLAIIDLSPGGAQPMHSADRRHVITFNGEIYNYRDIRRELEAAGRPP